MKSWLPLLFLLSFADSLLAEGEIPYKVVREWARNADIIEQRSVLKGKLTFKPINPQDRWELRLTLRTRDGEEPIPLDDDGVAKIPELNADLWETASVIHNMPAGSVRVELSYSLESCTVDLDPEEMSGLSLRQFTTRLMKNKDMKMLLTELPKLFAGLGLDFSGVQGVEIYPSAEIVGTVYLTRDDKEVARYNFDLQKSAIWSFEKFHPDQCAIHFEIETEGAFPLIMAVPATKEELKTLRNAMALNLEQDGAD